MDKNMTSPLFSSQDEAPFLEDPLQRKDPPSDPFKQPPSTESYPDVVAARPPSKSIYTKVKLQGDQEPGKLKLTQGRLIFTPTLSSDRHRIKMGWNKVAQCQKNGKDRPRAMLKVRCHDPRNSFQLEFSSRSDLAAAQQDMVHRMQALRGDVVDLTSLATEPVRNGRFHEAATGKHNRESFTSHTSATAEYDTSQHHDDDFLEEENTMKRRPISTTISKLEDRKPPPQDLVANTSTKSFSYHPQASQPLLRDGLFVPEPSAITISEENTAWCCEPIPEDEENADDEEAPKKSLKQPHQRRPVGDFFEDHQPLERTESTEEVRKALMRQVHNSSGNSTPFREFLRDNSYPLFLLELVICFFMFIIILVLTVLLARSNQSSNKSQFGNSSITPAPTVAVVGINASNPATNASVSTVDVNNSFGLPLFSRPGDNTKPTLTTPAISLDAEKTSPPTPSGSSTNDNHTKAPLILPIDSEPGRLPSAFVMVTSSPSEDVGIGAYPTLSPSSRSDANEDPLNSVTTITQDPTTTTLSPTTFLNNPPTNSPATSPFVPTTTTSVANSNQPATNAPTTVGATTTTQAPTLSGNPNDIASFLPKDEDEEDDDDPDPTQQQPPPGNPGNVGNNETFDTSNTPSLGPRDPSATELKAMDLLAAASFVSSSLPCEVEMGLAFTFTYSKKRFPDPLPMDYMDPAAIDAVLVITKGWLQEEMEENMAAYEPQLLELEQVVGAATSYQQTETSTTQVGENQLQLKLAGRLYFDSHCQSEDVFHNFLLAFDYVQLRQDVNEVLLETMFSDETKESFVSFPFQEASYSRFRALL